MERSTSPAAESSNGQYFVGAARTPTRLLRTSAPSKAKLDEFCEPLLYNSPLSMQQLRSALAGGQCVDTLSSETLRSLLRPVQILAWQLLLDTGNVRATVPMIRGVWGRALRAVDEGVYRAVFEPEGGSAPGYLLRPSPPDPATSPALHWILLGPGLSKAKALRRAWDVAAGMGLGPNREPFVVRRWLPLANDGREAASADPWSLAEAVWPLPGGPADTPCQLCFPAPLRILRHGRLLDQPTLADLTIAAWRRVQAFLPESHQQAWLEQRDGILTASRRRAGKWSGERLDLHRWSARQQAELDLRGVRGGLALPDGPGELWPLLAAAQWLHIGKATVFGLGEVQVHPPTLDER
jgi:hypothetical protein